MSNGGLGRVGQLILPMMDDTTIASKTFYIFVLPLKTYLVTILIDLMTEKTSDHQIDV